MAISTYAELQAAAANWLVRADLTSRIVEFIALGEARLNRVLRMRRGELDVSLTATLNSRTITLPAAYSEALNVWIAPSGVTERIELRFVDPALLTVTTVAGRPLGWTIDGSNLAFERPCDQAYPVTLRCLEKFILSDAAPTNSLLTDCPDAYLFATLCEAAPFLRDADLAQTFEQKLGTAVADINSKEARSRAQGKLSTEAGELTRYGHRSGYNAYTDGYN